MTDKALAIKVKNVSKKFGLTLRQTMKYGLQDVSRRLIGKANKSDILRTGEFWAVDNVSFELHGGESLGIMGVNGCGKTTLLRMLNGVYTPDVGRIEIRGRVGALIAAGAGFAPMLSGRENIYVNGALLGLSTKEMNALMDEIIAFSELGDFIDLPVKNYSSGMYVRLGFAIAALSKPDVLLMDEVLAVGDLNFQKKCYDYILQLKQQGTAIILVSHSPGAIWSVCDRGLFMHKGQLVVDGPVENVIKAYEDQNSRNAARSNQSAHELKNEYGYMKGGTGDVICHSVKLLSESGDIEKNEFEFCENILIEADVEVKNPQENLILRFTVDAMHYRFIATLDSYEQGFLLSFVNVGKYKLKVKVNKPNFRPGSYNLNVGITTKKMGVHLFYWAKAESFMVKSPANMFLYADQNAVMHLNSHFEFISG